MQEFTVVCTTCQSRIKVRNPNLVGQIVPCPKCSSMVLIENNNRIVLSPLGDAANSQTETKEAIGPLPNTAESDPKPGGNRQQRFRADENTSAGTSAGEGGSKSQRSSTENSSPAATATVAERQLDSTGNLPDLARTDWVSAKAKARRQILLVFFLSLSSCVVAVVLFVLFLRSWNEKPKDTLAQNSDGKQSVVVEQPEVNKPSDPPTSDGDDADTVSPKPEDKSVESSGDNTAGDAPSSNSADPETQNSDAANTQDPQTDKEVMEPSPDSSPAPPNPDGTNNEEEMTIKPDGGTKTETPNGLPSIAPPINDTSSSSDTNQTPQSPNATPQDTAPALPDSLLKLATVFDPSLETRLGELPGSRMQAGLSTPDISALPVLSSAKLHPPAAPPMDVAKRLEEEIAGIEIQDRPLSEVLALWSQLSGVGLELSWSEIAAANVEPAQLVTIRLGRTTFQDLLNGVLTPLGLEFVSLDKSIVRIAPQKSKVSEVLPTTWKVSDLITEKSPLTEIERIVRALNPALGESCQFAGEEVQWRGDATPFQKYAVLETIEHLRVMRGIPLVSTYKPTLFQRTWPDPNNGAAVKVILTQPAVKNSPVIQTLSQGARESGAFVSVDWTGTWEHGLSPFTEDTFLSRGRSLSGLADAVAFKYGLEVAWLSPDHAVLTTVSRLNQMEMMVHFELSDQRDVDSIKRRLSRFSTLTAQDLPSIRFAIDPESDMLLAIIRPLRTTEVGQRP